MLAFSGLKSMCVCVSEGVLQPCATEDFVGAGDVGLMSNAYVSILISEHRRRTAGRRCRPYSSAPQSQQPDGKDPCCFGIVAAPVVRFVAHVPTCLSCRHNLIACLIVGHTDDRTESVCKFELRPVRSSERMCSRSKCFSSPAPGPWVVEVPSYY